MTLKEIEYLHKMGKMPDRYYYMQNGQSPECNLILQRKKINEKILQMQEGKKAKKEQEKVIAEAIEKDLPKQLEKEFQKIFSKR